jgi:hypothetical protein
MSKLKSDKLYVELGAQKVRRRLKGYGFGVRRVEAAGRNRAVIFHTATGDHLRQLTALFQDVLTPQADTAATPETELPPPEA